MNNIPSDKLRRCSDEAFTTYGTAYIFEKRAANIRFKLLMLNFLGIAVPISVGTIIGTYDLDSVAINIVLVVSGTIAFIQLLLSVWSLVSGWNNKLADYLESKASNYNLSSLYQKLFGNSSISEQDFDTELRVLDRESELRSSLDNKFDVSEKEKRMGMRYSLRKFQRPCANCQLVPVDMKSTSCGVCGDI